jgi:AraC-like DNA-binding protein
MIPSIPLPFVITFLLIILLVRLISQRELLIRPAIVFVGACATLATIVGLRWSFNIQSIRLLQPIVASSLPPIAWLCFAGLKGPENAPRLSVHAIPVGLVAILAATRHLWHPPIDLILAVLFFGYGIALLRIGSRGPDGLAAARLADAAKAHMATLVTGLILISSGAIDLLIAGDIDVYHGAHARLIVGIANMVTLPLIAYAVAVVGKSVSFPDVGDLAHHSPTDGAAGSAHSQMPDASRPSDRLIVEIIDALMRQKQLFRDPDLTLNRLARRAGIPSRQISGAINRVFGRNVSQVVNEYRIEEAKRLLALSDLTVTFIVFEAGFQTKSNFNREFLRVTGMSPSDYRRSNSRQSNEGEPISAGSPSPEKS